MAIVESKTQPSLSRLQSLAGRWVKLQLDIEAQQGLYRSRIAPYDNPDMDNYAMLLKGLDPLWNEQKALFYDYPFEEMVWQTWIKPWMDEGYTNWKAAVYPYWVKQVFELFE